MKESAGWGCHHNQELCPERGLRMLRGVQHVEILAHEVEDVLGADIELGRRASGGLLGTGSGGLACLMFRLRLHLGRLH
jgi:hypothetical protein